MTRADDAKPSETICTSCFVGRMRNTGITWIKDDEIKVLFSCDECGATGERNAEPEDVN